MKKLFLKVFIILTFIYSASAVTKLKLSNGTILTFEGCTDNSVRFEASGTKPKAPVKEFELKKTPDSQDFIKDENGNYIWHEYKLVPQENGYTLFYNENELYTSSFSQDKKLLKELRTWKEADEFYGFGEASRFVSLRNQSFTIFNESKYGDHACVFVPFYVTNKNTAVYYNANGRDKIYFQDGSDSELYRSEYFRIECFVRQDSSMQESVSKFYAETETSCILPKWAYGYIQSKYGYKSCDEVIKLAETFKEHDIPLSGIVLDLYWFKKMGDIWWTSPDFANFKAMNEYLNKNDIKLITITEPFYTENSENFEELKASGLLCKNDKGSIALWNDWWCFDPKIKGGVFNPLGKKASSFMGKKYSRMIESGIDGFWTDLGEPEKAPADVKYGKYKEQDFHNYYNYYWTKALYEGVHKTYPDKRLFILSRSATTGSGKFNVSTWSGDVPVSWPGLGNQIASALNAGICGLPYWGSDVGGFVGEKSPEELYLRWQQFGAFTPVYRAHGTGPREPYAYPEKTEKIVQNFIKMRMQLLPYIYSTARQTMKGLPMMRPMQYEDAATPQEFINNQFMFGNSILVAPVLKETAATSDRTFYLPKGNWYNLFTMEKVSGGKEITVKTKLENIPAYVKEGAIIPAEKDGTQYLFVLPAEGISNSFTLYNDDGETEQYKTGNFSEMHLTLEGKKLTAQCSENKNFLAEKYTIVLPSASTKKYDFKTVTLKELEAGIEL